MDEVTFRRRFRLGLVLVAFLGFATGYLASGVQAARQAAKHSAELCRWHHKTAELEDEIAALKRLLKGRAAPSPKLPEEPAAEPVAD
jgi:hypothetical protein